MSSGFHGISRRSVLAGLAGLGIAPALANVTESPRPVERGAPPEARPRPDPVKGTAALIAAAHLSGSVSCALADARSGDPVTSVVPDLALPPASVLKTVTAAYAFDTLGPGFRFATRVIGTGPVRNGRLEGDLVLAGGGAPDLDTQALSALADELARIGLTEVTGDFLVWDGTLPQIDMIDPGQPAHLGYNASVSGLNLNYNRVHFGWRLRGADYDLRMEAGEDSAAPLVTHSAMQLVSRAAPVYTFETDPATGQELWTVARGALGGGGTRWLPVRDSAVYAAEVFQSLTRSRGLVLPQARRPEAIPEGAVLASVESPPLFEIARDMLKYSNNLTAEVLGLTATTMRLGAAPTSLADSAAPMTAWARDVLGMTSSHFVDHSGLGEDSRVTTHDLCTALVRLGHDGTLRRALKSIPLFDDRGRPVPLQVDAKTGTLNFVSALAGYVEPFDGSPMVFAILTADMAARARITPGDEDRPPGTVGWTGRSRKLQFDLVRLWGESAA